MKDKSYGIVPIKIKGGKIFFLLIQHHIGHWAFSKGHKEKGETDVEAASRELKEETGLKKFQVVDGVNFFERYKFTFNGAFLDKTVKYYLGIVKQGGVKIQKKEIKAYRWLSYEDAMKLITYPEGKNVLEEAKKYLDNYEKSTIYHSI